MRLVMMRMTMLSLIWAIVQTAVCCEFAQLWSQHARGSSAAATTIDHGITSHAAAPDGLA
ncbi:unnamed protein product [Ectocarpus sp. CCAP 1310/34]|nr:unnamed protein product [Ectocarpus sp. CCAP 1310/34]